jgi:yecA family protein
MEYVLAWADRATGRRALSVRRNVLTLFRRHPCWPAQESMSDCDGSLPAIAIAMRDTRTDPPVLQPPKINTLGTLTFTPQDREALSAWLAQDGWPPGGMDIVMLEGYLVALLTWPVRIEPGAWLPPIWGQTGWKVAAKIDSQCAYRRFIELVVGFLGDLDRGLCDSPPNFIPSLPPLNPSLHRQTAPEASWAQGFLKALLLGAEGLGGRSDSARSAVTRIARYASSAATPTRVAVAEEITSAVMTLTAERASRGPLGPLPQSRGRSCRVPQAVIGRR